MAISHMEIQSRFGDRLGRSHHHHSPHLRSLLLDCPLREEPAEFIQHALYPKLFGSSDDKGTGFTGCNEAFESKPPSSRAGFKYFGDASLAMKNGEGRIGVTTSQEPRRQIIRRHVDLWRHPLGSEYDAIYLSILVD